MANHNNVLEQIGTIKDPWLVQILRATVKIVAASGRHDTSVSLRPDSRGVLITADGGTVVAETLVAGHLSRPVTVRPADVTSALTGWSVTAIDVAAGPDSIVFQTSDGKGRLVGSERAQLVDQTADLVANANELVTVVMGTKKFTAAATYAAGASSRGTLPVLAQVQMQVTDDALVLRATDRFRLHTVPVPAEVDLVESWGDAPHGLPVKVAQDVGKLLQGGRTTLTVQQRAEVDGEQVAVITSGRTVVRTLLNAEQKPRFEQINDRLVRDGGEPEVTVTVPGVELRRATQAVNHQTAQRRGRDHSWIYLEATGDGVGYGIHRKDGEDEPLGKIEGPVAGPAGSRVVLGNAYLAAAAAGRKSLTLELRGPNKMVTVIDGAYRALIMAVRSQ